jgi:putative ABC transport system permease protein
MENPVRTGGLIYLIKIAYRNIYRNFRRSVLCFIATGIAVFFMVFMAAYIDGMLKSTEVTIQTFNTGHLIIHSKEFENKKDFYPVQYPVEFQDKTIDSFIGELQQIDGIKAAFPRISSYATLTDSNVKHAILWGIDTVNEFKINKFNLKASLGNGLNPNGLVEGRYPAENENACAIGVRMAKKMGVKVGDKIRLKTISSQYSDKFWNPTITGIFDFDFKTADENFIIVPFKKMQKILILTDKSQEVLIFLKDPGQMDKFKKIITNKINNNEMIVKSWKDHYFIALMDQSKFMINIVFIIFIVVASFLIINTVLMVIHERIKEIGMMGALGMNRGEIVQVFFFEAIILSIYGSFFGAAFGGIVIFIMQFFPIDLELFTGGGMEMPMGDTIFIYFSPLSILFCFFFGILVSSLCTLFPSLKSAFVEPVEALRR